MRSDIAIFHPFHNYDIICSSNTSFLKDVLFVDSGDPWKPRSETLSKVMKMLESVHKVLKPEGAFISISFGQVISSVAHSIAFVHFLFFIFCHVSRICSTLQPHFRRPLFESPGFTWTLEWSTFGEAFHYFFYILKKVFNSFMFGNAINI